jgi:hypothetical protein
MRFSGNAANDDKDIDNDDDENVSFDRNQDESIDPDEADERAYREELARIVKKEEDSAPEKA